MRKPVLISRLRGIGLLGSRLRETGLMSKPEMLTGCAGALGLLRRKMTDHQRHHKTIKHLLSEHCASDSHSHLSNASQTDLDIYIYI